MLIALFVVVALLTTAEHVQADPVAIALLAPVRGGFVDTNRDIQDSINDVRGRLSGMKEFRLVDDVDEADIVITIVERGVGSESYGLRLRYTEYFNNAELTSTPIVISTLWVSAVLDVGSYRKEFVGTSLNNPGVRLGTWRECARDLVNNLKAWAMANSTQLKQRRQKPMP